MTYETKYLYEKTAEILSMCACLSARKASRAITQIFDEELRPSGIRATQLPILIQLLSDPATTIAHLTERLIMDRTSLSRLLKPLEAGGFIAVKKGFDRRTRVMTLSERGRQAAIEAIPFWENAQARVIERLGEPQWKVLHASLGAVAANVPDK